MKQTRILLVLLLCSYSALTQPLSFDAFSIEEYQKRRENLMDQIPDGIAVIQGAVAPTGYYRFFQNNDFMYLCGLEIPGAVLVIDGTKRESLIFFSTDDRNARNFGIPLKFIHHTSKVTGINKKMELSDLSTWIRDRSQTAEVVYTMFYPEELMRECSMEKLRYLQNGMTLNALDGRKPREDQFVEWLRANISEKTSIKDCSGLVWDLRVIKSEEEIALLRKAGQIGVEAHKEMMKATYPGQPEYELAAIFEYGNKKRGAQDLAYYTIICAGENHPYLHYHTYDGVLKDGDFLVIDGGPDLHYYDIDITISYPVNGVFTERQKEIYEACNAMHEACMKVYRPGLQFTELPGEVDKVLKDMGYDTSLPIFQKFRASFGHYVGMAVHDVGGSPRVLKPGMVFANEPLAVFADENLGVRVEDTILITEDGCENLTAGLPRSVREIEAFMKR